MARALRRSPLAALAALVASSTALHWLAARRVEGLWIMPDEAIYAVRALRLWEHGSLPLFGASGAGYSALYPALAGGPLATGSLATGYAVLKPVQSLVMSLAAVPVYLFVRRLSAPRYGLLAAALTLAAPIVLFSGFVMTEVLYYPVAAAALLASARAVATGRLAHQAAALALIAVAVATRLQAVVLLGAFALALLVDAGFRRRRPSLRGFWPVWLLVGLGAVVAVAVPGVFGAYQSAVGAGYSAGDVARLGYDHLAFLALSVGVVPAAALGLLLVDAVRGRERDPGVRALVAVSVCAVVVVVAQVGAFSSRFAPHLLERDLAALPPLLFAVFAVWVGRGAPRPRVAASVIGIAVLGLLVAAPWGSLASVDALPDSPGLSLLIHPPVDWRPATLVAVAAAALVVGFRFVPRLELVALVVVALFCWESVRASELIHASSATAQQALVGEPRDWIGRATRAPVAYLYDDDLASWPVVWEQRFWNPGIDHVYSIPPNSVPGPIAQSPAALRPDGRLPITEPYAVANAQITLDGVPVAKQDRGPDQYPLVLWRLTARPALSTMTSGVLPNGDMPAPATVTVFACDGGALHLTLLPKNARTIEVDLDGSRAERVGVRGKPSWTTTVPVGPHGPGPCTFTITGDDLIGSTVIDFERPN